MGERSKAAGMKVGVVGLGLMGSSIVVSLLSAGHVVIAIAPVAGERSLAQDRIRQLLKRCGETGRLDAPWVDYLAMLCVSEDYGLLAGCGLVLECVTEQMTIKEVVYAKIDAATLPETIIATNTSAIPISVLQEKVPFPERFIGIHWSEPAFATRFMEIICGRQTSPQTADSILALALLWNKEPTVLRKDIRGFITNRLMYAAYREAFSLVEARAATLEDIDKSFRYDEGSWMTLMGIFRRMDFIGLDDYQYIFTRLFPLLDNSAEIPSVMEGLLRDNLSATKSRGVSLYKYYPGEADRWQEAFARYTRDINGLACQYPSTAFEEMASVKKELSQS